MTMAELDHDSSIGDVILEVRDHAKAWEHQGVWNEKHEKKEAAQWKEIREMKRIQYITLGAILLATFAIPLLIPYAMASPG